jgi:gamma-glutamylaminecyclotransferase
MLFFRYNDARAGRLFITDCRTFNLKRLMMPTNEKSFIVFTYGSLKRNYGNHRLIEGQEFLGEATTLPNYRMYDCGLFPCMVATEEGKGVAVKGELYKVDEKTISRLDRLEGVPFLYKRVEIKLQDNKQDPVISYLYQKNVGEMEDCGDCWPRMPLESH